MTEHARQIRISDFGLLSDFGFRISDVSIMPKDEFDFDDPLELNGVGIVSNEDTTAAMTECFVEEFMRLGHNHKQILALFRNPHYLGMNLALEKRGEQFVRDTIAEVFARRGTTVVWNSGFSRSGPPEGRTPNDRPDSRSSRREEAQTSVPDATEDNQSLLTSAATAEMNSTATDPMGAPIPDVTI